MITGSDVTSPSIALLAKEPSTVTQTYTVPEIAVLLRISKSKAYDLCKQDKFRTIRIGRSVRVSKTSFCEWLDKQN